jgi:hypothetical protein
MGGGVPSISYLPKVFISGTDRQTSSVCFSKKIYPESPGDFDNKRKCGAVSLSNMAAPA